METKKTKPKILNLHKKKIIKSTDEYYIGFKLICVIEKWFEKILPSPKPSKNELPNLKCGENLFCDIIG